mgnify:CR=1 FL=1
MWFALHKLLCDRECRKKYQYTSYKKELILKITEENNLDKNTVEKLAQDRFSKGVKELNKLEASGLIEELIEKYPSKGKRSTTPAK